MASTSRDDRRERRRRRNRNTSTVSSIVDVDNDTGSSVACIDLTLDASNDDIIDLTYGQSLSAADFPDQASPAHDLIGPVRSRRRIRRQRTTNPRRDYLTPVVDSPTASSSSSLETSSSHVHVLSDQSDSDSLPELPFKLPPSSVPDSSSRTTIQSPEGVSISCPVCLDDIKQIRRSGRQIVVTNCGHIFCDECIHEAINIQHTCPTCRKKLTRRNIHPLYI